MLAQNGGSAVFLFYRAQPVSAYREEIGAARLKKDSGGHYKACSLEEGLATC